MTKHPSKEYDFCAATACRYSFSTAFIPGCQCYFGEDSIISDKDHEAWQDEGWRVGESRDLICNKSSGQQQLNLEQDMTVGCNV